MSDTEDPKYDKDGRLLDPDSGKLSCLANECEPTLKKLLNPAILAVEVLRGINIAPAEKPWPTMYHQAIRGCRELRFGYDTPALKGDFILHIRLFKGSREANKNEFYVGLPRDFDGHVELYRTRLMDGFGARHLPEALKIHAIQHILKCGICKEWVDIMVWAEDEDVIGEVAWRIIREKARYVIEDEETDVEENEDVTKDKKEGRCKSKYEGEDTTDHKDKREKVGRDENYPKVDEDEDTGDVEDEDEDGEGVEDEGEEEDPIL